ncbi:MAG TPA: hypothetical protein VH498_07370 [Candidatus Dormibacteraeota bacterium]|nr:hypothetical protein [Candidatus Dormibacteraeota bacterium]
MPTSESAKAQKRLRKVEQAHARLADLAQRINAQAAAIADLMAQASAIVGDSANRAAPAPRPRKPAARKPAARKPAARKPAARKPAARTPATRKPTTRKAAPTAGA